MFVLPKMHLSAQEAGSVLSVMLIPALSNAPAVGQRRRGAGQGRGFPRGRHPARQRCAVRMLRSMIRSRSVDGQPAGFVGLSRCVKYRYHECVVGGRYSNLRRVSWQSSSWP
jgi:hypothetical protein